MDEDHLRRTAARQHGLLARPQARAALTDHQITHRLRRGAWERVRPGVYRVAGTPSSFEQAVLAACLAAGADVVASHTTAAHLLGLDTPTIHGIDVTVLGRRRIRLKGVRAHHTEVVGLDHTTRVRGIPVTSAARTLCDVTASWPTPAVERALDQAQVRGLTTLRALERMLVALATPGRRRITVLRALLDARGAESDRVDSTREARVVRVLRAAGLPAPVVGHRIVASGRRYVVDLAYPEERIAIEYDGWHAHRSRSAFDHDRTRQNHLMTLGWTVLRFTSASTDADIGRTLTDAWEASGASECRSTPV